MLLALREALGMLSYNTYHFLSAADNPHDVIIWNHALDAKFLGKGKPFEKKDWDELFEGYQVG